MFGVLRFPHRSGPRVALGAVALFMAALVVSASPASAYAFECGKFLGSSPTISYRY